MYKDLKRRIERLFEEHGDVEYRFERTDHHLRLVARRGSQVSVSILPVSGSDWRGPKNALATLRRDLGLRKAKVQRTLKPACKERAHVSSRRLPPPSSPVGVDSRVSLQEALAGFFQGTDDFVGIRHG